MSEEKFLAFKGLKQYDPGMGWAQVHNFNNTQSEEVTQTNAEASSEVLHDPLLGELFEQLNRPAQDELAQNWKVIAGRAPIGRPSQCFALNIA